MTGADPLFALDVATDRPSPFFAAMVGAMSEWQRGFEQALDRIIGPTEVELHADGRGIPYALEPVAEPADEFQPWSIQIPRFTKPPRVELSTWDDSARVRAQMMFRAAVANQSVVHLSSEVV